MGFLVYDAHMKTQQSLSLKHPEASPSSIHINGRCNYREEGDIRVIFANGIPLFHYAQGDKAANQYAMIHLVESGLASQQEVAEAFNYTRLTIFRAKRKFDKGGMAALVPKKRGPKDGSKVDKAEARRIVALKEKGLTNVAIGSRLGLKEDTVRKALKRMGYSQRKVAKQMDLPLAQELCETGAVAASPSEQIAPDSEQGDTSSMGEAETELHEIAKEALEPEQVSYDADPSKRTVDRALARLGFLHDAVPLFRSGENIPHAGVLIAIPALVESGIFSAARKIYGSLEASFYGLRTTFLTL